eukprot:TRINITY_DN111959_c0_g1_i1.p1 TRINITY_DN111959_c0_g1~~TRINITY_DN111959_c0_g1_i1.p1  ORF type:complete len:517 (+),score=125.75 TRINITY_DN111959_c0_g1_i1:115-1665(+)
MGGYSTPEALAAEMPSSDRFGIDGDASPAVACRICYAGEFKEGKGAFLDPTPCKCTGHRAKVHEECLRQWQSTALKNGQWHAGSRCHACHSPYTVLLTPQDQRTPIGIIGGTGLVGRALAARLLTHPVFRLGPIVGSSATVGRPFEEVWKAKEKALVDHYGSDLWKPQPFPEGLSGVTVQSQEELEASDCRYVVSAVAPRLGHIEDSLQEKGFVVFSISPHARTLPENPLVVPEANGDTLLNALLENANLQKQRVPLIKSPNCVTCGISVVLKAIDAAFGLEAVAVTTFQALSGRGDAMYEPSLVVGNVYPLTGTEERTDDYQRSELMRIFPQLARCSVTAHRVPVQTGHFVDLKVQLRTKVSSAEAAKDVLRNFNPLEGLDLPSQPKQPIVVVDEVGRPRPLPDADHEGGMAVAVGNVRANDGFFDLTLSVVLNNVVRGAWGAALINAELYDLHMREVLAAKACKEKQREHLQKLLPMLPVSQSCSSLRTGLSPSPSSRSISEEEAMAPEAVAVP